MEHSEAISLMNDYFANKLDRAKMREFHRHVNDCEKCREFIRDLREANRQKAGAGDLYDPKRETERNNPAWRLMRGGPIRMRGPVDPRDQMLMNRAFMLKVLVGMIAVFILLYFLRGGFME